MGMQPLTPTVHSRRCHALAMRVPDRVVNVGIHPNVELAGPHAMAAGSKCIEGRDFIPGPKEQRCVGVTMQARVFTPTSPPNCISKGPRHTPPAEDSRSRANPSVSRSTPSAPRSGERALLHISLYSPYNCVSFCPLPIFPGKLAKRHQGQGTLGASHWRIAWLSAYAGAEPCYVIPHYRTAERAASDCGALSASVSGRGAPTDTIVSTFSIAIIGRSPSAPP